MFASHNVDFCFLDLNTEIGEVDVASRMYASIPLKEVLESAERENSIIIVALKDSSVAEVIMYATNAGWGMGKNLFESNDFMRRWFSLFLLYNRSYLWSKLLSGKFHSRSCSEAW